MQGDLISRRAALQALKKAKELASEPPTRFDIYIHETFDLCIRLIAAFCTVDAVPVIRCKDCKHRGGYNCPMYHTETSLDDLDGFDDYNVDKTDGDGFCHRGERRG